MTRGGAGAARLVGVGELSRGVSRRGQGSRRAGALPAAVNWGSGRISKAGEREKAGRVASEGGALFPAPLRQMARPLLDASA